ncbi:MAG: hypothetical protein ABFR90_00775, partial [Planctomycetota bacterium]
MDIGSMILARIHPFIVFFNHQIALEHFKFLCSDLGRREDTSGKAKNAANAIHCRVFSTTPD